MHPDPDVMRWDPSLMNEYMSYIYLTVISNTAYENSGPLGCSRGHVCLLLTCTRSSPLLDVLACFCNQHCNSHGNSHGSCDCESSAGMVEMRVLHGPQGALL